MRACTPCSIVCKLVESGCPQNQSPLQILSATHLQRLNQAAEAVHSVLLKRACTQQELHANVQLRGLM